MHPHPPHCSRGSVILKEESKLFPGLGSTNLKNNARIHKSVNYILVKLLLWFILSGAMEMCQGNRIGQIYRDDPKSLQSKRKIADIEGKFREPLSTCSLQRIFSAPIQRMNQSEQDLDRQKRRAARGLWNKIRQSIRICERMHNCRGVKEN